MSQKTEEVGVKKEGSERKAKDRSLKYSYYLAVDIHVASVVETVAGEGVEDMDNTGEHSDNIFRSIADMLYRHEHLLE